MGGSAGPGNHSAAAEFNAAVDLGSINMCFDALEAVGVPLHMVGLDACRQVRVNAGDARKQREAGVTRIHLAECAHVLSDLLLGYVRMAGADGASPMALYGPTAAAALVALVAMQWRPARVVAECRGEHTRGMTVVEWRVPKRATANALVASVADEAVIRGVVLGALASAASGAIGGPTG